MPDDDRPSRRLDDLPQSTRLALALIGLLIGLALLFVGARSCETSLNEPTPATVPGGVTGTTTND